jgi:hypothetical protein
MKDLSKNDSWTVHMAGTTTAGIAWFFIPFWWALLVGFIASGLIFAVILMKRKNNT